MCQFNNKSDFTVVCYRKFGFLFLQTTGISLKSFSFLLNNRTWRFKIFIREFVLNKNKGSIIKCLLNVVNAVTKYSYIINFYFKILVDNIMWSWHHNHHKWLSSTGGPKDYFYAVKLWFSAKSNWRLYLILDFLRSCLPYISNKVKANAQTLSN